MMFICNTCEIEKPLSEYGPNRWTKSGHTNKCKKCCVAYQKQWALQNPHKIKAWDKQKYEKFRSRNPPKQKESRETEHGRLCSTCKERKPPEHFGKSSFGDGTATRCKLCLRNSSEMWRYKDLVNFAEKSREKSARRYAKHGERLRKEGLNLRLLHRYKISQASREEMLVAQGFQCRICSKPIHTPTEKFSNSSAHIDHCHISGKVRGLLCPACNSGLGNFKDNTSALRSAIAYLKEHRTADEDNPD